jgi:citrate synthase
VTDSPDTVSLQYPGGTASFPVVPSVEGPSSIDLSTLTKQTGYTALDPGFVNTASTSSKITFVDGENGVLRYRGYSIDDVAANLWQFAERL